MNAVTTSAGQSLLRILVREAALHFVGGVGFAVYFHIGVDKEVERRPLLCRHEREVAARTEGDAILSQVPEVVAAHVGMAIRLGNIDRHPALAVRQEPGPAVIAADLTLRSIGGNRETDLELGGNLLGAGEGNKQAVEVGAVADLAVAGPVGIAA